MRRRTLSAASDWSMELVTSVQRRPMLHPAVLQLANSFLAAAAFALVIQKTHMLDM